MDTLSKYRFSRGKNNWIAQQSDCPSDLMTKYRIISYMIAFLLSSYQNKVT